MEQFIPYIWNEDPVPAFARGCRMCELSAQKARMTWGEGNTEAKIIVILDNPGRREDKNGTPFVCGTRQTLQKAAAATGLGEKDLYVTYILKCRPKRKYDKETARGTCISYLEQQLQTSGFEIVFCLGDTAVKAFFGDPGRSVKDTRGKWQNIRGLPTYASYHPLAVRKRPNLYGIFLKDWEEVSKRLSSPTRDL